MSQHFFVEKLEKRLLQPLPGEEAQFKMAPISRKKYSDLIANKNIEPKLSAVLILIYPENNSFNTIFIKRPKYDGVHSGQIAFPGGKYEPEDLYLINTAIRESKEEIGIDISEKNILGTLSDVYITPSNYLVKPFIGFINYKPTLLLDKFEVESTIETDFFSLNNPSIIKETSITYSNGLKIKPPYYFVEGNKIWGATAMMISELNEVIKSI